MAITQRKPLFINASGNIQQASQTGGSEDVVALANGGTGAPDAATARTNLGVQAAHTNLSTVSGYASVANLTSLNNLSGTGLVIQTAANTFTERALATANAARLTVTNGDGVAGAPTFDLATVTDSATGTFLKITRDTYGRVSGTTAVVAGDISGLVDARYLQLSGGALTNFLTLHADPSSALHAATKQYVDAIASSGIFWKASVRAATTANIATLAGGAPNTIDGVTLAANDRVLVKDQTTTSQNGIYVVATLGTGANGTWTRATDADGATELATGSTFWVSEGTVNADVAFTLTTNGAITVGTTGLTFSQSGGITSVLAGNGLIKNGTVIDLNVGSEFTLAGDQLTLATTGVGAQALGAYKVQIDTKGRVLSSSALTAADISAQTSSTTLTNLTTLGGSGTGFHVQTAANTFALRSITQSTGITVTNGDGVAGNPSIALTSGIATPGTYYSVTVDTYGRVTSGTGTSVASSVTVSLTNAEAGTTVISSPVYSFAAGSVKKAVANSSTTAQVVGFASADINAAASGSIITNGVAVATTGQWDAVTGQTGGLSAGAKYFLDPTTAGKITTTVPATGFVVPVGIALSSTQLNINIGQPIQL